MMPENEQVDMKLSQLSYIVNVEIGAAFGNVGAGSIAVNNEPFLLTGIRHQIIYDGVNTAAAQLQDGLYSIDWSLMETQRFFKGARPMANAMFGSPTYGNWKEFNVPIPLQGNETLNVAVMNLYRADRTNPWEVQIIFDGLERAK